MPEPAEHPAEELLHPIADPRRLAFAVARHVERPDVVLADPPSDVRGRRDPLPDAQARLARLVAPPERRLAPGRGRVPEPDRAVRIPDVALGPGRVILRGQLNGAVQLGEV